jgi:hypothetical protein
VRVCPERRRRRSRRGDEWFRVPQSCTVKGIRFPFLFLLLILNSLLAFESCSSIFSCSLLTAHCSSLTAHCYFRAPGAPGERQTAAEALPSTTMQTQPTYQSRVFQHPRMGHRRSCSLWISLLDEKLSYFGGFCMDFVGFLATPGTPLFHPLRRWGWSYRGAMVELSWSCRGAIAELTRSYRAAIVKLPRSEDAADERQFSHAFTTGHFSPPFKREGNSLSERGGLSSLDHLPKTFLEILSRHSKFIPTWPIYYGLILLFQCAISHYITPPRLRVAFAPWIWHIIPIYSIIRRSHGDNRLNHF